MYDFVDPGLVPDPFAQASPLAGVLADADAHARNNGRLPRSVKRAGGRVLRELFALTPAGRITGRES